MKKILIIKMGYSETLDSEMSKVVSLGDVLRCTVILESLKAKHSEAQITWLVSNEAIPLVSHNPLIDRILVWDEFVPYVLMREQYDMVINLEKINGICALVDMMNAWEKVGFRFNSATGQFDTYLKSMVAKEYISKKEGGERQIWQRVILEMIGVEWKNQEYSLGYAPKTTEIHDIGFNYHVGKKWPTKAYPEAKWKELEVLLSEKGFRISWQQGMNDLYEYIDWINSCKMLISNDSLGLHIALALGKKVIGLFGPTDSDEIFFYDRGIALKPSKMQECIPCYLPRCHRERHCMEDISIQKIVDKAMLLMDAQ